MNLGGPELLLVVVSLVPLALVIWAVVDAAMRPDWVWQQAGQNKMVWVVVPAVSLFICGIVALVMAIVYLASIRSQLETIQRPGPR